MAIDHHSLIYFKSFYLQERVCAKNGIIYQTEKFLKNSYCCNKKLPGLKYLKSPCINKYTLDRVLLALKKGIKFKCPECDSIFLIQNLQWEIIAPIENN